MTTTTTKKYDEKALQRAFDAMDHASIEAQNNRHYPPRITKDELEKKIIAACKEVGIDNIIIHEWNKYSIGTRFTDGVVREEQYDTRKDGQVAQDIAYLVDSSWHPKRTYHLNLVRINYDNFSHKKGEEFHDALTKQGLQPEPYHPSCGPIFPTDEMIQWDLTKDTKALYR